MNTNGHVVVAVCGMFVLVSLLVGMGCNGCNPWEESLQEYPISDDVVTTRYRTIAPVPFVDSGIKPWDVSQYDQDGYGKWTFGDGSDSGKLFDIMPAGYEESSAEVTAVARLMHFAAMTDIHITDKESPAQLIYMAMFNSGIGRNAISLYSGIMLYTTHVLDAAVQTVNAIHKQQPVDFGIFLGDVCNSAGYNELRWFIDVVDGQNVNPDSGAKDDPVPGPYNDYQDPYKATGLDAEIPWYSVIGNHDQHWMGSKPAVGYIRDAYTSTDIMRMGNVLKPGGIDERSYYMGALNGSTVYGDVYGAGRVEAFSGPPQVVRDLDRRPVASQEWMAEFLRTSSNPVGHGFTQESVDHDFACYSFEPRADMPVKVIVLDDTVKIDTPGLDPRYHVYGYGTLDQERYDWLVAELEEGQANNKLMIIAAHVPIGVEPAGSPMGWWAQSYVSEEGLIAKLQEYPNLILWIAGHRHLNTITPFQSPDPDRPELGFWGVETVSLREYPQQFRTFDIVRNSDNTISILVTNVDPAVAEGSFAATSRSYAIAAAQLFDVTPEVSRNAALAVQLSPEMQVAIQQYGTPITE